MTYHDYPNSDAEILAKLDGNLPISSAESLRIYGWVQYFFDGVKTDVGRARIEQAFDTDGARCDLIADGTEYASI